MAGTAHPIMNPHASRSYDVLWLSLSIVPLVTLSFLFSIHAMDYWWYVRIGQETLLHGAVPSIDTISWTQAGTSVIYQPWLAGVIFWLVYELGGATLTYLLRGVLLAVSFGVLWTLARQASGPRLATILILVMGLSSTNNWQVRPQLFAYPLFALCLYSLYQWHQGKDKTLWILPAAMLLWSNLHGSFALGLILAGTALVFGNGNRKSLLIVLGLMVIATLLNPRGFGNWQFLNFMLRSPSDQLFSVEWFPPQNSGWQLNIFFAWMLVIAPIAALSGRKLTVMEWVLFLGFGWLAFSGIRYVIWCLFILAVISAAPLADLTRGKVDSSARTGSPLLNIGIAGLFTVLSLLYLPGIRESWWSQAPDVYALGSNPIAAVDWLKAHPDLPGPIWNDFAFGSYLAFALPSRPTWLDTRFFIFPPEQMKKYQEVSHATADWESLLQADGVNLLLLSQTSHSQLIASAASSPDWCEQYRDPTAVIFSRCEPIQ
jgi:hypothetical protein